MIDQWHTVSIREEINMKNQKIEQKKAGEKLHRYWSPYTAGNENAITLDYVIATGVQVHHIYIVPSWCNTDSTISYGAELIDLIIE